MHSATKRRLASPVIALVALATFAGVASAAPSYGFQTFGEGNVQLTNAGATFTNEAGEYSGVYVKSKSLSDKPLADLDVSFKSTGQTAGGAPRFSLPLNTGVNQYAFLDASNCGTSGVVSTNDPTCRVFLNFGTESFANWDAFAAAKPSWRIAKDATPFIIADVAGTYTVSNIDLR
jgi:hypothetical protein